jgi:adenylate kinase
VAVIGPPGAGKGTLARELGDHFGLILLSTGDLFRQALQSGTSLGRRARGYMERGELVPDELVEELLEERVGELPPKQGALFDGFPRTEYQARLLDDLLASHSRQLSLTVHIELDDKLATERLAGRLVCRACDASYNERSRPPAVPWRCDRCGGELLRRADDEAAIAGSRLRTYRRTTAPVLAYYAASGRLGSLNGDRDVTTLTAQLVDLVQAVGRGDQVGSSSFGAVAVTSAPAPGAVAPVLPSGAAVPSGAVAPVVPSGPAVLDMVLLGGPGSGKGTQAVTLSQTMAVPHISTGDLFRDNLRLQTNLGRLARSYMDRGELVPDEVTEEMVRDRLGQADAEGGFLLDGFPRSLAQAEALDEMLIEAGRRLLAAVNIAVSDDEIVRRLSGRLVCRNCGTSFHREFKPPSVDSVCDVCGGELYRRDDDRPDTIKARLRTFHGNERPLVEHYRRAGVFHEVDGEGRPDQVAVRALALAATLSAGSGADLSATTELRRG